MRNAAVTAKYSANPTVAPVTVVAAATQAFDHPRPRAIIHVTRATSPPAASERDNVSINRRPSMYPRRRRSTTIVSTDAPLYAPANATASPGTPNALYSGNASAMLSAFSKQFRKNGVRVSCNE